MSEQDSKVSRHILAQLEGERIRVIRKDGHSVEGKVHRLDAEILYLGEERISLAEIATYFVLKES